MAPGVALDDLDRPRRRAVGGGITQALSPECTPASSTCSITPPMTTSPVASRMASTSTSMASSRNRSISTGRSADRPPSRPSDPNPASVGHRPGQAFVVVDDLHGPAAEHVARAHEHRVADPPDDGRGLGRGRRRPACRLGDLEAGAQGVPAFPVLGQVDRAGRRTEHQLGGQLAGELQRGLPPRATMTGRGRRAGGLLDVEDVGDVLEGQRLEVEPVAGVVVGRDRLGVAVHHHGLEAGVAKGEAGLDAAVVELDALTDAVRARPEDDHLRAVAGAHLVGVLVGRVVVRGVGVELGAAGVDGLERGGARPAARRAGAHRRPRRLPRARPSGRRRSRDAWPAASRAGHRLRAGDLGQATRALRRSG